MSELEPYNVLINELISPNVTEERFLNIKNKLLQIVFDFKDISEFDSLVEWNNSVNQRVISNRENLEIPGNIGKVVAISGIIRRLSLKNS